MAKQIKRTSKRPVIHKSQSTVETATNKAQDGRRIILRRFRNGALALAGLGAGGWYISSEVIAGIQEADLSKIGNGIPTIVQIHDPQCPICRTLQQEARKALTNFEDGELQYLVANIKQIKGKKLAAKHGVQHVTLVLLDGKGRRSEILTGSNTSDFLEQAFRRHLERE